MIIRSIPVPLDLPTGYDAILIVYAKSDNRNTHFIAKGELDLLDALAGMTAEKRIETIANITRMIEQMLLQSSNVVTRISDASKC